MLFITEYALSDMRGVSVHRNCALSELSTSMWWRRNKDIFLPLLNWPKRIYVCGTSVVQVCPLKESSVRLKSVCTWENVPSERIFSMTKVRSHSLCTWENVHSEINFSKIKSVRVVGKS